MSANNEGRKFAVSSEMHERRLYTENELRQLASYYYNNMDTEEIIDIEKASIDEIVEFIKRSDKIKELHVWAAQK